MKFVLDKYHRDTPSDDLIKDLQRVANILGINKLTQRQYNIHGEYHPRTIVTRFGSWFEALEKAGLKKTRNLALSNEDLFKNLEEVWVKLGRQPRYSDIEGPLSEYSPGTYAKRFGGYRKALEAFIEFINLNEEGFKIVKSNNDSSINRKTSRGVNWRLRFIVMRRDRFKCVICGRSPAKDPKVELHVDHIIPWSKGGETVLENLQTLCSVCNIGKSNL